MDSDSKFWIAVVACLCWTLIFIIGCVTVGTRYSNERYYDAFKQCVEAKGTPVPQFSAGLVCIIK